MKRRSTQNATEVNNLAVPEYAVPQDEEKNPRKIQKKGKILNEVREKRERNIKYFLKDNLTFEAAIYKEPVHYFKDGRWKMEGYR